MDCRLLALEPYTYNIFAFFVSEKFVLISCYNHVHGKVGRSENVFSKQNLKVPILVLSSFTNLGK